MTRRILSKVTLACAIGVLAAGCATEQQNRTAVGTGAGAAVGAGLGALIGDSSKAAAIGAGIGAVAGGIVGYNWGGIKRDVQQAGAPGLGIDVTEQPDGTLKVNIPSGVSFDTNSFTLKPELLPVLDSVARALQQNPQVRAKVVGHTDSTGQAAYNQTLSQNRARSVVEYLTKQGVQAAEVTAEGRGANDPIADNGTSQGRAENRRVEIYLYAVQK